MTRIRTIYELQQGLDDELAWRKVELAIIQSQIPASSSLKAPLAEKTKCHIRSGVTLLYAHWEGFIKVAGNLYLEYIMFQRLKYIDLANNFVAMAAKKFLHDLDAADKVTAHIKITEFFLTHITERCSYLAEIETKSNLSSAVLKEIVDSLGLDYNAYVTEEKLIDETLLKNRNHIAHGNYLLIDIGTFNKLQKTIIGLMELFAAQISNAASMQAYKRTPTQQVVEAT